MLVRVDTGDNGNSSSGHPSIMIWLCRHAKATAAVRTRPNYRWLSRIQTVVALYTVAGNPNLTIEILTEKSWGLTG